MWPFHLLEEGRKEERGQGRRGEEGHLRMGEKREQILGGVGRGRQERESWSNRLARGLWSSHTVIN